MEDAIVCRNVEKQFDNFSLILPDFHVQKGTVHGLIGPNGSGKTTTLKLLLGILKPDMGTLTLLDSAQICTDISVKQQIGFIIEDASLPSMLNPYEIGKVMNGIYDRWNTEKYVSLLKQFHLDAKKPFRKCSRGMKVKIQLAVALSHDAKLLILDEPTSGLDPVAREEILDLLSAFSKEEQNTILISSHITSDLEKLCDYISVLKDGTIRLSEEKDGLLDAYRLVRISPKHRDDIDLDTIVGMKETPFSLELLMRSEHVPSFAEAQRVTLETLIIMMTKNGDLS